MTILCFELHKLTSCSIRPATANSLVCFCVCVCVEVQVPGWGDAPLGAQSSTSGSRKKCRDASYERQEPCCHGGHTWLHATHTYLSCQGRTDTHTHTLSDVHCWSIANTNTGSQQRTELFLTRLSRDIGEVSHFSPVGNGIDFRDRDDILTNPREIRHSN